MTSTPGESGNLEGRTVLLSMELEEQKGEAEKQEFRIVKFLKRKPETISLAEEVVDVHLFSRKFSSFFKATFDDPGKVVADAKMDMGTIVYTLEEILRGGVENVVMSYERLDGKQFMVIKTRLETKIFIRTVTFEFCYKFERAKMSLEERLDMKIGELAILVHEYQIEKGEQRLKALEERKDNQSEKGEQRLRALEEWKDDVMPISPTWLIAGKPVEGVQFDVSSNNYHRVSDNGMTLTHHASTGWNTSAVNYRMKNTDPHRARFRIASLAVDYIMFGVVSDSFSRYTSNPSGNGQYGWVAYFYPGKLHSSKEHDGTFVHCGGPAPFAGCVVTIEYYPKQQRIHYFVNSVPVGKHFGGSFNNGDCRFAVSLHEQDAIVKLLSVEQISDVF